MHVLMRRVGSDNNNHNKSRDIHYYYIVSSNKKSGLYHHNYGYGYRAASDLHKLLDHNFLHHDDLNHQLFHNCYSNYDSNRKFTSEYV